MSSLRPRPDVYRTTAFGWVWTSRKEGCLLRPDAVTDLGFVVSRDGFCKNPRTPKYGLSGVESDPGAGREPDVSGHESGDRENTFSRFSWCFTRLHPSVVGLSGDRGGDGWGRVVQEGQGNPYTVVFLSGVSGDPHGVCPGRRGDV